MPDMRWMMFVDGENFAIRGQKALARDGVPLAEGRAWKRDVFLWTPTPIGSNAVRRIAAGIAGYFDNELIRAHYYTSCTGGETERTKVREALRALGFDSEVFERPAEKTGRSSKGVDIALTTEMLSHAYLDNYGVAVLVTGDGDYVPAVEAVKRQRKQVWGLFFNEAVNPALRRACDRFDDLTPPIAKWWRRLAEGKA